MPGQPRRPQGGRIDGCGRKAVGWTAAAGLWLNDRMMRKAPSTPIGGRVAWTGAALQGSPAWTRQLSAAQVDTLDRALQAVNQRKIPTLSITRQDFPLPGFETLVQDIQDELENGLGFLRLTGLDADRYAIEDLKRLFWGFGTHLGVAVNQAGYGEMIGEVRDESQDASPTFVTAGPNEVKTSRARARSTGPLRFHTDRCDVIGLLCARNSMAGGVSKLASSVTIHDEILKRRPDLLDVLYQDFWRSRPADEDGVHGRPCFPLPVFALRDGKLTSQYSRTYVEQAQENASVPRLTAAQIAAMDILAEVAEEVCLHAPFATGDMQFCNNHVVYHGRTAYEDDRAGGKTRHLLRLWLSPPNTRALPEGFEEAWGSIAPGQVRGGIPMKATEAA